jgi:peroxiredoxin Q/BCP
MPELRRSTRIGAKDHEPPHKKTKTNDSASKVAESKSIEIGDSIPDLVLKNENDEDVNLTEISKLTKYLVIFAYPKASTPGCTRQVCGFQKNFEWLSGHNTTVYGLSSDSPKSQLNFVTKQGLKYHLLCDPSKKLIGPLGAKKSPSGIKRSHWIFKDGKLVVKKIQISPEVSINSAKLDIEEFIKQDDEEDSKPDEGKDDEVKDEVKEDDVKSESNDKSKDEVDESKAVGSTEEDPKPETTESKE